MHKSSKKDIKSKDIYYRLGAFDKALKNQNVDILSKNGNGFCIRYPYGILTIIPTRESVKKFVELAGKHGLSTSNDESVLNCCADKDELQIGGRVDWESERYSGNMTNKIKLQDWLQYGNEILQTKTPEPRNAIMPFAIIDGERYKTRKILQKTGTNDM